jgi:hypothetical protein
MGMEISMHENVFAAAHDGSGKTKILILLFA